MTRARLANYQAEAASIGVEIVTGAEAEQYLKQFDKGSQRAMGAFVAGQKRIYLRGDATDIHAFHEMSHAKQWKNMGSTEKYIAQGSVNAESHALDAMLKEARRNPTRWNQSDIQSHISYFFDRVWKNYLSEIGY